MNNYKLKLVLISPKIIKETKKDQNIYNNGEVLLLWRIKATISVRSLDG